MLRDQEKDGSSAPGQEDRTGHGGQDPVKAVLWDTEQMHRAALHSESSLGSKGGLLTNPLYFKHAPGLTFEPLYSSTCTWINRQVDQLRDQFAGGQECPEQNPESWQDLGSCSFYYVSTTGVILWDKWTTNLSLHCPNSQKSKFKMLIVPHID